MPTLFTMTVDTEEEWDWDGDVWPTENLQLSNIRELSRFHGICERHGVAPTYFTNSAVLKDPETRDVILGISSRNHVEIGMHIHPWNTPPLDRSREVTGQDSYLRTLPEEQIEAKLTTVYEAFESAALLPTSFRGGRYSSGGPIHEFLRAHGFVADASVVPYTSWPDPGSPDYRHRNMWPARLAPRHSDEVALWEIPLTLGFTRKPFEAWARRFRSIESSWFAHLRLIGLLQRSGFIRRVWLNFEDTPASDMLALLRVLRPMELPAVCFTVHSSSLSLGKNPYSRDEGSLHRIWSTVDEVFKVLAGWDDFQPATVSEVALQLESEHHASYRHQSPG
jgi:hypothetical protein